MESFVSLFFLQGRVSDLERAYLKDPQATARLIFYWRDRNKGLGRRRLFHLAFHYLVGRDSQFLQLLPSVPVYGCWKDLVVLAGMIPSALDTIAQLFAQQLLKDQTAMRQGKYITTAAKWFPSSHSAAGRSALTQRVQELLGVNEEVMRRTFLSPLRFYLQTAERQLSTQQPVNYLRVTRGANVRYAQTFRRQNFTWTPPIAKPRSLLEVIDQVLHGQPLESDQHWERYKGSASAVGVAVVCDPRVSEAKYPIALALAAGKEGIYSFSSPAHQLIFPVNASLAMRVAMLQASRTGPTVSLNEITAPCIIVVTSIPLPTPLPLLAPGQRLIWWGPGDSVSIQEHSVQHIEIRGFTSKLFSILSKGHIPSLAHIAVSTINKYSDITIAST